MIYFLLPRTFLYTYQNLEYIDAPPNGGIIGYYPFECETPNVSYISNSLSYYLMDIKERINKHDNEWGIYKKYTNPYEYIHSNIPNKKRSVSKHKPLSRAYFKMVEIVHFFNLFSFDNPNLDENGHPNSLFIRKNGGQGQPISSSNHFVDVWENKNPYLHLSNNPPTANKTNYTNTMNNYSVSFNSPPSSGLCFHGSSISNPIRSFHLAEGPGGFIEAILELRNNPLDKYIGMTLIDDKNDFNIPSWKKSSQFLKDHYNNVFTENGDDKTGNILSFQNFVYCKNKYGSTIDLITGDGGFDFSVDFKNQENNISRLLFAQIAYAVCMQKHNGHFILKIFDTFMIHTIDLLYLLSSFYEKVYVCKPQTSRVANSEKYLVCKNFLFSSSETFYPYFHDCFEKMMNYSTDNASADVPRGFLRPVGRFLNIPISNIFITKMEEYNSIFGQQQIENIYSTLSLIETKHRNDKIDTLIKNNTQKSIDWCIKYGVPYNYNL